jgi:hypothetical protein
MPSGASVNNLHEAPARRPVLHLPKSPKPPPHRDPDALDFKEAREELIPKAAYVRAAKRGVSFSAELEDWLAAEAKIDARLNEHLDSLIESCRRAPYRQTVFGAHRPRVDGDGRRHDRIISAVAKNHRERRADELKRLRARSFAEAGANPGAELRRCSDPVKLKMCLDKTRYPA